MLKRSFFLALGLAATLVVGKAQAADIALYSTGEANPWYASPTPLPPDTPDPHYALTSALLVPAEVVKPGVYPFVPSSPGGPHWVANPSDAQWIAPNPNHGVPNGTYTYTQSFTIGPGANLSTVSISFKAASDDQLFAVDVNGHVVLVNPIPALPPGSAFGSLHGPFTIDFANAGAI